MGASEAGDRHAIPDVPAAGHVGAAARSHRTNDVVEEVEHRIPLKLAGVFALEDDAVVAKVRGRTDGVRADGDIADAGKNVDAVVAFDEGVLADQVPGRARAHAA